jgi:hypothetical protein
MYLQDIISRLLALGSNLQHVSLSINCVEEQLSLETSHVSRKFIKASENEQALQYILVELPKDQFAWKERRTC